MHFFIYWVLLVIIGNGVLRADEESAKAFADDRPNIIFFLTDDQRNDLDSEKYFVILIYSLSLKVSIFFFLHIIK